MRSDRLEPTPPESTYQRLAGLDLARGLAVIGMVLVNFMYVFSQSHIVRLVQDESTLQSHSPLGLALAATVLMGLAGRAVAVFLVLFGIGMTLAATRARSRSNSGRTGSRWPAPQVRRYALLLLGGLAFVPLWEADILHFIGLFGLLSLLLARLRTRWLLSVGVAVLIVAELLRVWFNYTTGWLAIGSHYGDMWSVSGQLRQLFFNGYHPVFPWICLVIHGMLLGRLDLRNRSTLKRLTVGGVSAAVVGFTAQALGVPAEFFPAHTLFILLGMANATWVIAACLLVCSGGSSPRRGLIQNMGRLALSHYPGHVLLGIVPVVVISGEKMDMSFESAFAVAVVYLAVTAVLGQLWFRYHAQGPLEWALRVAASRPVMGPRSPLRAPRSPLRAETSGRRTE